MPPYRVLYKPSVERDLRRIPKEVLRRVLAAAEQLADDPFPRQASKLSGAERLYRVRVGAYRIVYEVATKAKVVTVYYIRHRRTAYG